MQPNIIPIKQRIEDNSIPITESGCWIWIYGKTSRGYGTLKINGKQIYAHRASYKEFIGDIPEGMLICHHCDTPLCVNPKHLFSGTCKDNHQDRERKKRGSNSKKIHCPKGHEYIKDNIYRIVNNPTYRRCRQCCREKSAKYYSDNRLKMVEYARKRRELLQPIEHGEFV